MYRDEAVPARNPTEPSFVIGGGQRCGTTTLRCMLDGHPDIFMARPAVPEPKFFLSERSSSRDRESYLRTYYADIEEGCRIVGEKSTSCLETAGTAHRMKMIFPHLKIVLLLRHPVERAISNYRFSLSNRLETLPFSEAIRREEERGERWTKAHGASGNPFAYVKRGRYAKLLAPFCDAFSPKERMIALTDHLQMEPANLYVKLLAFLGVDTTVSLDSSTAVENASATDGLRIPSSTIDDLFNRFESDNRQLESILDVRLVGWSEITPYLQAVINS